jgi:cyclic pyranopterin monophosphate synthase
LEVNVAELSHVSAQGAVTMVDVAAKPLSRRVATAKGKIRLDAATLRLINTNQIAKGNVLTVAQIAAISAVKRTGELIPLCHPLPIQHVSVGFEEESDGLQIECTVTTTSQTGVEMEALTGVSVAALTIYDMCKAVDKSMVIDQIRLVAKTKSPL